MHVGKAAFQQKVMRLSSRPVEVAASRVSSPFFSEILSEMHRLAQSKGDARQANARRTYASVPPCDWSGKSPYCSILGDTATCKLITVFRANAGETSQAPALKRHKFQSLQQYRYRLRRSHRLQSAARTTQLNFGGVNGSDEYLHSAPKKDVWRILSDF